ncbi:MAG: hypothetical protein J1E39_08925 [Eubacterium sp.]|nr:hypothetical protein [Eubacterium sp.]
MSYINAEKSLPPALVKEIRRYVGDGLIYIPPEGSTRKAWGSLSGARKMLEKRNNEIRREKHGGKTVKQLAAEYCLSEDTIRRILYRK